MTGVYTSRRRKRLSIMLDGSSVSLSGSSSTLSLSAAATFSSPAATAVSATEKQTLDHLVRNSTVRSARTFVLQIKHSWHSWLTLRNVNVAFYESLSDFIEFVDSVMAVDQQIEDICHKKIVIQDNSRRCVVFQRQIIYNILYKYYNINIQIKNIPIYLQQVLLLANIAYPETGTIVT